MGGSAEQATARSGIAAQSLFTASAAVNAIPVAGQFASAGLAIAGMFVKIFGGRRKRKKEAAARASEAKFQKQRSQVLGTGGGQQASVTAPGVPPQGSILPGTTAAPAGTTTPSFRGGGGTEPSMATQQVLKNRIGF